MPTETPVIVNQEYLQDIADAIRAKNGSLDTYTPAQMSAAISAISTSGSQSSIVGAFNGGQIYSLNQPRAASAPEFNFSITIPSDLKKSSQINNIIFIWQNHSSYPSFDYSDTMTYNRRARIAVYNRSQMYDYIQNNRRFTHITMDEYFFDSTGGISVRKATDWADSLKTNTSYYHWMLSSGFLFQNYSIRNYSSSQNLIIDLMTGSPYRGAVSYVQLSNSYMSGDASNYYGSVIINYDTNETPSAS